MANTVFRNAMGHVREERGISSINTDTMAFSTPPSLRATSPIFSVAKHRGGVSISDNDEN